MNYFTQILKFAYPYKRYAFLNIFFNILYAIFSSLSFLSLIPLMNILFDETKQQKTPVAVDWSSLDSFKESVTEFFNYEITMLADEHGKMATLLAACGLILTLFLLKNISNYLALFFITFLRNGVLTNIRNALHHKILRLPLSYFSEQRKGETISKMTNDVQEIQWTFLMVLELIIREPLMIIVTVFIMITISAKLTLFMFLFLPVMGLFISFIGKKLKKHSDRVQQEQAHFLSNTEETLSGLKVLKSFTAEDKKHQQFEHTTGRLNQFLNSLMNRQNLASPTSEFLGIISVSGILWFGGLMVVEEQSLSAGAFIGFLTLAYNILTPAKQISKALASIKRGDAAAQRVLEVLHAEETVSDKSEARSKKEFDTDITFENIFFKYQDNFILEDFNLKVSKGKTVALVGQSGSGKSTIANLVNRFYDVNQGSIKIDGTDIRDIVKKDVRQLIGLVTQDSILFNDSVKNNLKLGMPHATDEEVIAAAKIANAHEFISKLDQGYNTNIGDGGGKLSGGQKQRLSIARAVLKNPPIMVLDEATSALDTESEKLVQKALENMMQNRTSIVIAHRLSTIQNADLIVVMQEGKIVEQGTHSELLAKKGTYKNLVAMQSLDEI
ncbi:MAG: ABC transporter ATP-binding protein/permease [Flavobacteriaceae bacterium]|nr:ABC transporter ATP-binding protein/permease [Flavobacteriaceae bacterium]